MKITICAFRDDTKRSVAYRNFDSIDKAVSFYQKMLENKNVNTISTRCINEKQTLRRYTP